MARLGPQLPAAGDLDQFIGPRAQFVANVGEKIVEIASLPDESWRAPRAARARAKQKSPPRPDPAIRAIERPPAGRRALDRTALPVRAFWTAIASLTFLCANRFPLCAKTLQSIEPKTRPAGEFAHGAKLDEPIEQAAGGAIG